MNDYLIFALFSLICVILATVPACYIVYKNKAYAKKKSLYSEIMLRAAKLEYTYYQLLISGDFRSYPTIKKYLSQSKLMLNDGVPLYKEPNLVRMSNKDTGLNKLISELKSAPEHLRKAVAEQACLLSDIIEAQSPLLSKLESVKKNTTLNILLYLLKLLLTLDKYLKRGRTKAQTLETAGTLLNQSNKIMSAACPEGC